MIKVKKRTGKIVDFDENRIANAVQGALTDIGHPDAQMAQEIAAEIHSGLIADGVESITIAGIQKRVETALMSRKQFDAARAYIEYRHRKDITRALKEKAEERNRNIMKLIRNDDDDIRKENSNKDTSLVSTRFSYMAEEANKEIASEILFDKDLIEAHKAGMIHIHDMGFAALPMHNCDVWNLDDMLQNGTVMNGIAISKPKSLATAVTIATQIVISIAASQYGGQTFSISALAPFVRISYEKHMKEVKADAEGSGIIMTDDQVRFVAENRLRKEIKDAVQTLQYQLISCAVSNGQAPFVSVFMYLDEKPEYKKETAMLAEEILRQRYAGIPNKQGVPVSVAFPKLLFVLDEDNVPEDSEYHYLLKMAVKCSAKRMVPDYISAKKMKEYKEGNVFPCMGCRSFLSPWKDENGNYRFYGRFNQGVVTVNLVDAALSSGKDEARFWEIMKERTDLCYRALMTRHKLLLGTKSDVAPILWQHGALARLKPGEVIDPLLFGGYSTISLGYVGLYECTLYMTGHSHTSPEGKAFAMKVMKYLNDRCDEWRAATDIGFSVYGTPEETTTDKFAKCLKKRFGIVPGITDHDYVTNSYHVNPAEKIDAFSKLALEGEFQAYSLGGEISYVEVPNMEKNLAALESVVEFMYDNTVYAEVNTKSDYCQKCGYDGEMLIDPKRMEFYCPNCGNTDYATMNITRRVCGYLSTNFPTTHGRMADISARVLHLDAE